MGGHWSPSHAPLSKEATRGEMCQGELVDLFNSLCPPPLELTRGLNVHWCVGDPPPTLSLDLKR
jgi:hypothetical protein